jgi:hypothetical protein
MMNNQMSVVPSFCGSLHHVFYYELQVNCFRVHNDLSSYKIIILFLFRFRKSSDVPTIIVDLFVISLSRI